MAIATGLISSLFNAASSQDVPFHQLQQLQCLDHGSTKAYLCSPLCSIPFSSTVYVTITQIMASVQDLGKYNASRGASYSLLGLLPKVFKVTQKSVVIQQSEPTF